MVPIQIRLSELAQRIGATLQGGAGEDPVVGGITTIDGATSAQVTFVTNPKFLEAALKSPAAAVILPAETPDTGDRTVLRVANMLDALLVTLRLFHPERVYEPGVHGTAVIDPAAELGEGISVQPHAVIEAGAKIGARTVIGAGVFIGRDVEIGTDCLVGPRAVVMESCVLGNRVLLQPGAIIGADGFKYQWSGTGHVKIPQVGIVVIEDDVEIGAGACIDRASFTETRIGRGSKIDNLVQIGHNCQVGQHCIVVAQVGLAGSVKVGDGAILGGQVGSADNIKIGAGAQIGAQSGLHRDVPAGAKMFGTPAVPAGDGARNAAALNRLPAALRELRQLVERVEALEKSQD